MFKKLGGLFSGNGGRQNGGRPAGAPPTPASSLRPMTEYAAIDPAFREAELTERLANLYVQLQNGWTDKDIAPLRPYLAQPFYTRMEGQLDQLRRRNQTNYVDRIAVLGVTLRGFLQQGGEDHIIAELRTRIVDYTMDDRTGEIVSGDRRAERFMTYEWNLSRPSGAQTAQRRGVGRSVCPNCGAPLDRNVSARCPYCGEMPEGGGDWALCSIKGLAQQTVG